MRLEFDYEWRDVRRAYLTINKKIWVKGAVIYALILLVNLGIVGLARLGAAQAKARGAVVTDDPPSFLLPIIVFGVIVALLVPLNSFLRGGSVKRKMWLQNSWYQRRKVVDVTAEGIVFSDTLSRLEFRWPAFRSFRETGDLFCFYSAPLSMYILPKRVFATAEELNAVRNLARNLIPPENAKQAFPMVPAPTVIAGAAGDGPANTPDGVRP